MSEQGGLEVGVGISIQVRGCCKALRVKPYPWPLIKPSLVGYDHGLTSWVIPRCSPTVLILHTHRLGTYEVTEAASSSHPLNMVLHFSKNPEIRMRALLTGDKYYGG